MIALLSPRTWLAIGLALVLGFSHAFAYRAGKASVRADWNASIITQQQAAASAEAENRRLETLRQSKVVEAQNAQVKRTQVLQASLTDQRRESLGLRDDLASFRFNLPSTSLATCRERAAALSELLGDVEGEGAGMARAAAAHSSDSLMLQQAWPR